MEKTKNVIMGRIDNRLFLVLLILGLLGVSACKTTKNTIKQANLPHSLLWKIEGNGIEKPSYLFGTIHIIGSDDYFLPKGLKEGFDDAEKVFFEIDVDDMTDMSKMMGLMNKILMSDDKTLKDLISEKDYEVVEAHFQKLGLPLLMLERMKPMFLEIFAMSDFNPGDLKNGSMKSYEFELNNLAKSTNKVTGGLESIEYQLSIFDSIPYEYQAKRLVEAIKLGSESKGSLDKLVKIYKSMDIDAMANMTEEEEGGIKGYEDLLLYGRNRNWIPVIEREIKSGSRFFAVGAAHLGGENGVIRLLMKEGYHLTAVNSKK